MKAVELYAGWHDKPKVKAVELFVAMATCGSQSKPFAPLRWDRVLADQVAEVVAEQAAF